MSSSRKPKSSKIPKNRDKRSETEDAAERLQRITLKTREQRATRDSSAHSSLTLPERRRTHKNVGTLSSNETPKNRDKRSETEDVVERLQRLTLKTREQRTTRESSGHASLTLPERRWTHKNVGTLSSIETWKWLVTVKDPSVIMLKIKKCEASAIQFLRSVSSFEEFTVVFDLLKVVMSSSFDYWAVSVVKMVLTVDVMKKLTLLFGDDVLVWLARGVNQVSVLCDNLKESCLIVRKHWKYFDGEDFLAAFDALLVSITHCLEVLNEKISLLGMAAQDNLSSLLAAFILLRNNEKRDELPGNGAICFYPQDLFLGNGAIEPNIICGSYMSSEHYIRTQLNLLKEDFERRLRDGIALFLKDPKARNHDVWVYQEVTVKIGVSTSKKGNEHSYQIVFNEAFFNKIEWDKCDRFLHGSMVIISSDKFKVFHIAIVRDRGNVESKNIKKGEQSYHICVEFLVAPPRYDRNDRYLMVEPKTFFEPYHQVMMSLASFSKTGLPLERYLVDVDTSSRLPEYATDSTVYTIDGSAVRLKDAAGWPSADVMAFNDSQRSAVMNALASELVLIQGPPGTGKTYTAYKLIRYLIANKKFDSPILVVCYKNHSLDQILEGLLDQGVKLLRVGGQSKSEKLKDYNLSKIVTNRVSPVFAQLKENERAADKITEKLRTTWNSLNLLKMKRGIVHLQVLKSFDIITNDIFSFFKNQGKLGLEIWLNVFESIPDDDDYPPYPTPDQVSAARHLDCSPSILYSISLDELILNVEAHQLEYDRLESTSHSKSLSRKERRKMLKIADRIEEDLSLLYSMQSNLNAFGNLTAGKSDVEILLSQPNLNDLSLDSRWKIYNFWETQLQAHFENDMREMMNDRFSMKETHRELKDMFKLKQLEEYKPDVLGITTSGAAAHHRLLEMVGPAVVIVEEAAEVLESHVVASVSKSCQQLVLIGDHKQLKPSTASHMMAEQYKMNVSLFERMMLNEARCDTLNVQHRMRPEIAALISPSIYPGLVNHPSVTNYPDVAGVSKNVVFFHHTGVEETAADSESRFNRFEADFALALCSYLLKQETYKMSPSRITLLTTYKEQERFMLKGRSRLGLSLPEVRITAVDNYQGEENDVVILSLVRNNVEGNVGFLATENRVCVALSRAKHGLYILGNIECLVKKKSSIWCEISDVLVSQNAIVTEVPLKCKIHGNVTLVKNAADILALKHGGCNEPCLFPFECGHLCTRLCHGYDLEHEKKFSCQSPCNKKCPEGHPCSLVCSAECVPCPVPIPKILPCSHAEDVPCSESPTNDHCRQYITFTFEECGHELLILCKQRFDAKCQALCDQDLSCGHKCPQICHVDEDRFHEEYKCLEKCSKTNALCPELHECTLLCSEECGPCMFIVKKVLDCTHPKKMECCKDIVDVDCYKKCKKILQPCGHPCPNVCGQPCGPCSTEIVETLPCGHECRKLCGSDLESEEISCTAKCTRLKSCGHECFGLCSEDCDEVKCGVNVEVKVQCGHAVRVKCHMKNANMNELVTLCKSPCGVALPVCGHICRGTCGLCLQGRVHKGCSVVCNKTLRCSHTCKAPCGHLYHSCNRKSCNSACWNPSNASETVDKPNKKKEKQLSHERQAFNLLNGVLWKFVKKSHKGEVDDERPERATLAEFASKISVIVTKFRMKRSNTLVTLMSHIFLVELVTVANEILETIKGKPELECIARFVDALIVSLGKRDIHHLTSSEIDQTITQISFLKCCLAVEADWGEANNTLLEMWNDQNFPPRIVSEDEEIKMALFEKTDKYATPIVHHSDYKSL